MLLCKLLAGREELQAPQGEALALKAANDLSNKAPLNTIWLHLSLHGFMLRPFLHGEARHEHGIEM